MTKTILGISALTVLFCGCGDGGSCWVGDHRHKVGDSFRAADGCNTCTCESNGSVSCTLMACLGDAGYERPDLRPRADVPADLARDATPDQSSVPADTKPGADRADAGLADAGPADAADTGRDASTCLWGDAALASGESVFDGCNTCSCGANGQMMCTTRPCPSGADGGRVDVALVDGPEVDTRRPDASASEAGSNCSLATSIRFGSTGGLVTHQDDYRLDPPGAMTITRTYYYSSADAGVRTCAPTLPACGASGVVSLASIVADLADSDVQAALAASTPPLFGRDTRPMDGTVYQVALGSGGSMLVGWACTSGSSSPCTPIPAGIQRLVDDLRSLATAMAAQAVCAGL